MKNTFFIIALFALACLYNSDLIAKVLPVNEEVESLDSVILPNNDRNDLSGLSVGIIKVNRFSYSNCIGKENIDIKNNLIYRVFQPFSSTANLVVGTEVFQLSEEYKIIGKNFPARFP